MWYTPAMSKAAIGFGVGTLLVGACLSYFLGPISALIGLVVGIALMGYGISAYSEEQADRSFFTSLSGIRASGRNPASLFEDFPIHISSSVSGAIDTAKGTNWEHRERTQTGTSARYINELISDVPHKCSFCGFSFSLLPDPFEDDRSYFVSHAKCPKCGNLESAPRSYTAKSKTTLSLLRCEVKPTRFNFHTHPPSWEDALCGYAIVGNPAIEGKPRHAMRGVAAKIEYQDASGKLFQLDGRWADSDQPTDPTRSTTHLLRVDFNVGDEHPLDIVAQFHDGCYAVNTDSLRSGIKNPDKKLQGPMIPISVRLLSEDVDQTFQLELKINSDAIELMQRPVLG